MHSIAKSTDKSKIYYLKANIKVNEVLIHLNYSENYKNQDQMKFRVRTLDRQTLVFSLLVLITAAAKQTKSKQCPQPSRRKRVINLKWLQLPASKK